MSEFEAVLIVVERGEQAMKVSQLMTRVVRTCGPEDTAADAARLMWDADCGAVPIVDRGRLRGIVTDRDLLMASRIQGKSPYDVRLSSLPLGSVETCREDDEIEDALSRMAERQVRRLPVLDRDDRLVGIVSLNDVAIHAVGATPRMLSVARTLAAVCRHRDLVGTH